jgi:hypothetical protein
MMKAKVPSSITWGLEYTAASTLPRASAVAKIPVPWVFSKYAFCSIIILLDSSV